MTLRTNRNLWITFVVIASWAAGCKTSSTPENPRVNSQTGDLAAEYSLDDLAAADVVLRVAQEEPGTCAETRSARPEALVRTVRALGDVVQAKLDRLESDGKLADEFSPPTKIQDCLAECRCNFYMHALTGHEAALTPAARAALMHIRVRGMGETLAGDRACADRNRRFCSSPLFATLKE